MTTKDTKDTVYLDVDEEITNVIQKVQNSQKSIVALVLPKRAGVFQSIVNMKLLKRTADQNKKKVVLITSEAGLLPLAGAAGIHVAPTLSSKPVLPPSPTVAKVAEVEHDLGEVGIDPKTPVGDLMDHGDDDDDNIEIDNDQFAAVATGGAAKAGKGGKAGKAGKGKGGHGKLAVPNFNKFRKIMLFGGLALVLLIVGLWWALAIAPKATITLKTEASETLADFNFTADTGASDVDLEKKVLPAKRETVKKTDVEKVPATGQKDNGAKAGGTITFSTPCGPNFPTIPAGTGVSSNGLTFITKSSVKLTPGGSSGGSCKFTGSTQVTAQNNGDKYNLAPGSYSVANFPEVDAQGSQMTGGTSEIIKVVSGTDIEAAKTKLNEKQAAVSDELRATLNTQEYSAITASFNIGTPAYTITPAVDSEASEVTVQAITEYTMLGVKEDDLKKMIAEAIKDQVDTDKQSILDEGLSSAEYTVNTDKGAAKVPVKIQTTVVVGPDLDQDQIKSEIAGKKKGQVQELLKARPGVNDVTIDTKPFWNAKVPKKQAKITIVIEQANGKTVETGSDTQP